jgi:hypothetical protein
MAAWDIPVQPFVLRHLCPFLPSAGYFYTDKEKKMEQCHALVSALDGRLRLRHSAFREKVQAEQVCSALRALDAVCDVRSNIKTGSILVHYDAAAISQEHCIAQIRPLLAALPAPKAKADCPKLGNYALRWSAAGQRHLLNRSMLASLGMTLAGIVAGQARVHIVAGVLFSALVGAHVFGHRRTL